MSDTAKQERMVRELVDRAARNQTVFVECSPKVLEDGVFSQPLHVMLKTGEDGAHMLVFKESDEIRRLRAENAALTAAIERVRALHHNRVRGAYECVECLNDYPCPTLRALEETP